MFLFSFFFGVSFQKSFNSYFACKMLPGAELEYKALPGALLLIHNVELHQMMR